MKEQKAAIKKTISEFLQELTNERGISQEAMAEHLHISSRTYGDLERGKYLMSLLVWFNLIFYLEQEDTARLVSSIQACVYALPVAMVR